MSRLVDQPVVVQPGDGPFGAPRRFRWQGQRYEIRELLDVWTDTGAWWDGEREAVFFRVVTAGGTVFELMRGDGGWRLYRIYD